MTRNGRSVTVTNSISTRTIDSLKSHALHWNIHGERSLVFEVLLFKSDIVIDYGFAEPV
jgi:hypothetical protein